ncbi:MAG: DUF1963 domain-containing protein [Gemmataceae bacterium]|nr:DUF1963 domain-containing protein [Gemmataceae bacterium]
MAKAPKPAFPHPAAVHAGEADILATVIANLSDDTAKLVYADWLDDRNDPRGGVLRETLTAFRAGQKLPGPRGVPPAWRDLVGLTLLDRLAGTDFAPHADALLALARPSIQYALKRQGEKSLPVGGSKFGGRPDLPPALEWPRFEGLPLSFFGQFNLADLRPSPVARELPADGVLSVFAAYRGDGDDWFPDGSWRLFHFPAAAVLARRELDDGLADESRFPPQRVSFAETLTLPKWGSPWAAELAAIGIGGYGGDFSDIYFDLAPGDHLLGYPYPIQGDILGSKAVRHLLTINSHEEDGWMLGDGGAFYFVLPEADLKAGRFDGVQMHMDCA